MGKRRNVPRRCRTSTCESRGNCGTCMIHLHSDICATCLHATYAFGTTTVQTAIQKNGSLLRFTSLRKMGSNDNPHMMIVTYITITAKPLHPHAHCMRQTTPWLDLTPSQTPRCHCPCAAHHMSGQQKRSARDEQQCGQRDPQPRGQKTHRCRILNHRIYIYFFLLCVYFVRLNKRRRTYKNMNKK